jgi:nucleotide-binding universal stress UspA family protein
MNDTRPEHSREAHAAEDAMSLSQQDKPVAQSASPASEERVVHKEKTRPADPKNADDVLTHKLGGEIQAVAERNAADAVVLAASRRRTRRAFVAFGAAAAAAYGYKQIKRIGLIAYTNEKPDDYWTKLGYD